MRKLAACIILCMFFFVSTFAQAEKNNDLTSWLWVQVYQHMSKKTYASFQCQVPNENNMSQFGQASQYFLGGYIVNKNVYTEILYQLTTCHFMDIHTFYAGVTY